MVDDYEEATGLEPVVDGAIEPNRSRAPSLVQCGVEIVIEQVLPHDVRRLRGLRHRDDVRRYAFDILMPPLLRERPPQVDLIALQIEDFGRDEAEDSSTWSHRIGEQARPVAVARVDVDNGAPRSTRANRINSDCCDWSYIGNLL